MPRTVVSLCLLLPLVMPTGWVRADDAPGPAVQEELRGEVGRLVKQLDDDQFEVRRRAAGRLGELVAKPELGRLLAGEFHQVLVRLDVPLEVRWHLERWCRRLPQLAPAVTGKVSHEEIDGLVEKLDDDTFAVRTGAARRLESLLYRDELLPYLKQAFRARLAEPVDSNTAIQIKRIMDQARPAMVAEYWESRRNRNRQHLLVDVPQMGPGAIRPSHFDRIDDRVAHCVSGNTLSPGDYPVGVAFPHPTTETALFHLVNLPTPSRRLAYGQYVKTDEAVRLAALSRRTLDRFLAEKTELSERELVMLAQLDPKEVSQFADKYFGLVEDKPLLAVPNRSVYRVRRIGGRPSRFAMLCVQLAADGTKEAVPGLLEAIDKGRFLPPNPSAPYRLNWIAALAIADRDPWPGADDWLGSLIARRDLLVQRPGGPELGATAAAVLIKRYQDTPAKAFRLLPVPDAELMGLNFTGYTFPSADQRNKARQWWEQESGKTLPKRGKPETP